ncbi:MAG TPA: hypothetical protein VHG32_14830 [Thermoanaerobaculia bacterium]|nr:hypothetical protein [Thermoanaerobaculia bacterium]
MAVRKSRRLRRLDAVRAMAPRRDIVVLVDVPLRRSEPDGGA